ncbi:TetR/AcrR family transcriptional regulator [Falsirhodobacter sp. 20TX0035]|uniref:TetR/AcrR family transcriptional regulator n=1 Tax=Falsirhodobacter sp. 20TX0035 TaxID=3022019 RepID=UPI00232DD1CC|nr:TetR/AcrR family transcriptional regulator [Falsirhodobacter sp. 20TX0035]MDB6453084.1 TetR/AcrR family transcriptional regulator [Falsirhodobacter sp. 20TX0035]
MEERQRRGRPRKFERPAVLQAAAECFGRLGYEGASIVDLTATMGISAQSLYSAFGTKAQLFEEALEWYLAHTGAFGPRALAEEVDPIDGIVRVLRESAVLFADGHRPQGCLICNSALAVAQEHSNIAIYSSKMRQDRIVELEVHLARGVKAGKIDPTIDTDGIARLVMSVRQGMSAQAKDGASSSELLRIVASFEPMLHSLRAKPGDQETSA